VVRLPLRAVLGNPLTDKRFAKCFSVGQESTPTRAGWVLFESIGDSQIGKLLIQHAGWEGGQHGWDEPIRTTFVSG